MTEGHTPDLIERVERAMEGSRELDDEIAFAISAMGEKVPCGHTFNRLTGHKSGIAARHYTTSIDAAVTLLPEGWTATFWIGCDGAGVRLLDDRVNPERLPDVDVDAATLPLALCAASLKARAIP